MIIANRKKWFSRVSSGELKKKKIPAKNAKIKDIPVIALGLILQKALATGSKMQLNHPRNLSRTIIFL
jgi:hypothetical protein